MTALTHQTTRAFSRSTTKIPQALMLAGVGSLCAVSSTTAEAGWFKRHGTNIALEVAQVAAPEPVRGTVEFIDTIRDTGATAVGAGTTYAVLGSSGPVIMGKLAAVGGPVTAGGVSGFGVAGLQNRYLYSDCKNANACDAAATAGYLGAGAGLAGATALGATYGVGATGLATIGSMVGGGMAAGAIGLIALPAVGAVAVGAGVYGLVSLFQH